MKKETVNNILSTSLRMVFILFAVSLLTFLLITLSPIDPITAYVGRDSAVSEEQRENIIEYWGLDQNPIKRYFVWGRNLLSGDMGESITYRQPVSRVIGQRFFPSLALMGTAWIFSGVLGFVIGIICGVFQGTILDRLLKSFCLLMSSTPTFWFGLLMLTFFSVKLGWFPMGLAAPIGVLDENVTMVQRIHHLILPALTLSISGISNIALHSRQKMIQILESDYVLFAKARGESRTEIVIRHGLRNIALPAVTLQFASFSELFGGSVLAEQVFSYPGLGNAAVTAGMNGDIPLLTGIALFTALFVFVGNLSANLLSRILNPRTGEAELK